MRSSSSSSFDVEIVSPQAQEFSRENYRYVSLPSHSTYKIKLVNDSNVRCDAVVSIDGQRVGTWIVEGHRETTIERPEGMNRLFTLVGETSATARRTGAQVGASYNGLVTVLFKSEKRNYVLSRSPRGARAASPTRVRGASPIASARSMNRTESTSFVPTYQSGVTVLGGRSSQEFSRALALRDDEIDWNEVIEVNIRLVVRQASRQEERYVPLSQGAPPRIDGRYRYTYGSGGRVD